MTAQILDGKALAATIKSELRVRVAALAEQGYVPGLGTVLVGDDPGAQELGLVGVNHTIRSDRVSAGIEHILFDLRDGLSEAAKGFIERTESAICRLQHPQARHSVPQMWDALRKGPGRFGFFDVP